MPGWLATTLDWLPFRAQLFMPMSIYFGQTSGAAAWAAIAAQVAWVAMLGLGSLVTFAVLAPVDWSWWRLPYLLAAVMGGTLVETAIQVAIASLAFRFGPVFSAQTLADRVITIFGIYPLTVFGTAGLVALTLIFPLGFIAYLPATALLGRAAEVPVPPWLVWGVPLAGWFLLPLAVAAFHRASRHYQSPGA